MDFNFGRKQPQDLSDIEDKNNTDKPSLTRSLSQGSQKFFGSVFGKKNGLLDEISSKFDQVMKQAPTSPPPMTPPTKPPKPPRPTRGPSIDRSNIGSGMQSSFDQTNVNQVRKLEKPADDDSLPPNVAINFETPLYTREASNGPSATKTQEAGDVTTVHQKKVRDDPPEAPGDKVKADVENGQQNTETNAPGVQDERAVSDETVKLGTGHKNPFTALDQADLGSKNPVSDFHGNSSQLSNSVKPFMDNIPTVTEPPADGDPYQCNQNILHPSVASNHFFEPIKPEIEVDPVNQLNDPWFGASIPKSSSDLMKFSPCPSPQPQRYDSGDESSDTEGCDDIEQPHGSISSSEVEYGGQQVLPRSMSQESERSWCSTFSLDSQMDDLSAECAEFMKVFVEKIFKTSCENGDGISQTDKAKFGEMCQNVPGRLWFARYVSAQRVHNKRVEEHVFYQLIQYFAVVLFECSDAEDYVPAKTIMNMCFTFYYEVISPQGKEYRHFLYSFLRDQPIWQSLRFWNAAFFDAVQCERAHKPVSRRKDGSAEVMDDRQFQENITFGQLGTFTSNMRAFGLSKDLCLEFLRKQSTIANLKEEQVQMLRENVERPAD